MPRHEFVITQNTSPINLAKRALVYLTVSGSDSELKSRETVLEALASLSDLDFEFFVVQEDDESSTEWLSSQGRPKQPVASGTLIWLEEGKRIATEIYPRSAGAAFLVKRTVALWSSPVG